MALEAQRKYGPSALLTPSNAITVVRLAATPFFVIALQAEGPSIPMVVAWLALSATDKLDGWLARRQGPTRSGAFLDPLADKVVVLAAMGALVAVDRMWIVPVLIIAVREAVMTAYRSYVGRRGISVPAGMLGKIKTVVQDLAVALALVPAFSGSYRTAVATVLWLAVALTVISGIQYLRDGRHVMANL